MTLLPWFLHWFSLEDNKLWILNGLSRVTEQVRNWLSDSSPGYIALLPHPHFISTKDIFKTTHSHQQLSVLDALIKLGAA